MVSNYSAKKSHLLCVCCKLFSWKWPHDSNRKPNQTWFYLSPTYLEVSNSWGYPQIIQVMDDNFSIETTMVTTPSHRFATALATKGRFLVKARPNPLMSWTPTWAKYGCWCPKEQQKWQRLSGSFMICYWVYSMCFLQTTHRDRYSTWFNQQKLVEFSITGVQLQAAAPTASPSASQRTADVGRLDDPNRFRHWANQEGLGFQNFEKHPSLGANIW